MSDKLFGNPYDPRDPKPEFVCRTTSSHPAYDNLRKTYCLLSIDTKKGKAYFVVEGLQQWPSTYEEMQNDKRYLYEEHTCPTNFISIPLISFNGDHDPHGIFRFEEAVWMIREDADEDYLCQIFPQLGASNG